MAAPDQYDGNGCLFFFVQDVKLSAEVEPFIPQKKGLEGSLVGMSLSGEAGGGGGGGIGGVSGGVETTPIPSYLITCYPFVQENQPNRYRNPVIAVGDLGMIEILKAVTLNPIVLAAVVVVHDNYGFCQCC